MGWTMALALVGASVTAYFIFGALQWCRRRLDARPLPHWSWPIVGEVIPLMVTSDPEKMWTSRFGLYGTRTQLFVTCEPEDVKRVFAADGKQVQLKVQGWVPPHIFELEGNAITAVVGPLHKVLRKSLFTLFSTNAMKNYFDTMKYFAEKHVREWKATQGPLTMLPLLRALAYEIVYGCMIDKETAMNTEQVKVYEEWIQAFSSLPLRIAGSTFMRSLAARKKLQQSVKALLHQAQREQNNPSENQQKETVVSMLLRVAAEMKPCGEEGGDDVVLDEDTIIDNLLLFLLAGHETVLSTLCSLMKVLPQHPEVVRKAQQEIQQKAPSGEDLTYERVQSLSYCTAVVTELLRYVPPVLASAREVLQPITLGPHTIPTGDIIVVSFQGVHHQAFTDPHVFDPDRFDREAEAYSSRYKDDDRSCFFSFASGIRSCIGMKFAIMEVVTLLAVLMREKVVWELVPGQDLSMVRGGLSLKYKSGVVVNML
ncbi:hypothetical protein QOT17_009848 [Balamuthia mandrillaris]